MKHEGLPGLAFLDRNIGGNPAINELSPRPGYIFGAEYFGEIVDLILDFIEKVLFEVFEVDLRVFESPDFFQFAPWSY